MLCRSAEGTTSRSGVRKNAVPGMTLTLDPRIIRTKPGTEIAVFATRIRTACVPRHQAHITSPMTSAAITGT